MAAADVERWDVARPLLEGVLIDGEKEPTRGNTATGVVAQRKARKGKGRVKERLLVLADMFIVIVSSVLFSRSLSGYEGTGNSGAGREHHQETEKIYCSFRILKRLKYLEPPEYENYYLSSSSKSVKIGQMLNKMLV